MNVRQCLHGVILSTNQSILRPATDISFYSVEEDLKEHGEG